jgi:membrane protein implicated in regulation of membrane protease activity
VRDWFWAWLIAAVVIAAVSAITRDRYTAPWAVGAGTAAALEAFRVRPGWQWIAFLVVSGAVFIAVNGRGRYKGRHARTRRV